MIEESAIYHCDDLTIDVARGQIRRGDGESLRLGPVNMAVLACLVQGAGDVVSRASLFENVWPHQIVSDDALTRAISDLRQQLKQTFGARTYIETLPKRGYRWSLQAGESVPNTAQANPSGGSAPSESGHSSNLLAGLTFLSRLRLLAIYLVLTVLIASAAVWMVASLTGPALTRVAVLPIDSGQSQPDHLSRQLNELIPAELMEFDQLALLSDRAVATRPSPPFPYLHTEFGVVWVVESRLRPTEGGHYQLAISVVDARTAIVSATRSMEVGQSRAALASAVRRLLREIRPFLEATP